MSDLFGKQGRALLAEQLPQLPPHTRFATEQLLKELNNVDILIDEFERRRRQNFKRTPDITWLMSLPGVGFILALVISSEVGDVHRFASADRLASYAGTTPRVEQSGGKSRFGRLRPDVNHYLKWAYLEAAIVIRLQQRNWPTRNVVRLYQRIAHRRNPTKALGAVARHLAEATYWMLMKGEPYREPQYQTRRVHEGVSASIA